LSTEATDYAGSVNRSPMLLFATASAPESVGGSLAALAIYDVIRSMLPGVLATTGDPLGALYRTFAHRTGNGAPMRPQPLDGVPILTALEDVAAWGLDHRAPALVCDATGDLRRDVRAWPDQLAHLVAQPLKTIIFIIANDSPGAHDWLDNLATNYPLVFASVIVLSYPIGGATGRYEPNRRTVPAPILHHAGLARLYASGLPPSTVATWNGPDRSPTDQRRVAEWLDAWRQVMQPFIATQPMLANEGPKPR
jgi:hypothetical protein